MQFLKKMSIRRKQTVIIMLAGGVALLMACVAFSTYEVISFRKQMVQELSTLAQIVGNNSSAALDFNDPNSATEILAGLDAEPGIFGACIYAKNGDVFAIYDRPNDGIVFTPPPLPSLGHKFERSELDLSCPIIRKGENIGTVYLQSNMRALYSRLTDYAGILGLIFGATLLAVLVLSSQLQKLVSNPILRLAKVVRSIATEKNYALRATKESSDELGQLIEDFNGMLAQIQQRDEALQAARDGLEIRVAERTSELAKSNRALHAENAERTRVETHLLQSQKLETVGKLAGGIAHEFNSIMTAIIGQSELMLDDLSAQNPLRKNAAEIRKAADRAATLTRQLLAFGRKQILQPEILDLNSVLAGMETVLRHLIGKNVDVRIVPNSGLKSVKVDAGQMEQVIVNIALNAADAMPNGGKFTLETANVTLDNEYVSRFPDLAAGEYVMLAITDTGGGMTEEVKARIFEPFFSTKGVGKGTGLGLSTCYGILKQSGGHIAVYSEWGRGATFKIYLPQVQAESEIQPEPKTAGNLPRGIETILMVEDDPALREMAGTLLGRLGYTVLSAANGIEALTLSHQQGVGHIDLLFTDVVMPHMSGKELADRIEALYPHTKILFTSAYTESAIVHQGVLNKGVALLQKPFTPAALAHKLRAVLDQPQAVNGKKV